MLTAFARAFKTPDLRKKLLFTLGIIVLYRLGRTCPGPWRRLQERPDLHGPGPGQQGLFGLVNMFSGGALLQITIFALGIMPYITASIILQLLTVVIPRLEALKKEGQSGQAKITQYTRYLTVALAILQGTGLVATARSGALFQSCPVANQIVPDHSIFTTITMVITMTAGTALIMWLGELVTDRGIGNGMSILMFISIAAGFPGALWADQAVRASSPDGWIEFGAVILGRPGHGRPGGLRRAGAAPDPGAVREADDRPPFLRRYVDLHPAQGEPGGCDPGHLRLVAALHPGADRPVQRVQRGLGDLDRAATSSRATTRSTSPRTSC